MRAAVIFLSFLLFTMHGVAQLVLPAPTVTEQQLEDLTAGNGDVETEDDSFLQELQQFLKHPVNVNTADETELKGLRILNDMQILNLLRYRELTGNLLDILELQAVPGWDVETIQKLRPYVSVSIEHRVSIALRERLRNGAHSILLRVSQVPESSKGYRPDSAASNFYPGSPQKVLLRYKYAYKNLLQFGIVAEKDAGEQFFKGKQKQGFDFYSAHIFLRRFGVVRSLAIGDFTVNLGQGLIQWQSLAFRKSADVLHIKREADVLRPYNAAGEFNFHRGAGVTLTNRKWELTVFGSYKRIDANFTDDSSGSARQVSSLPTSGYHRTHSETVDKGIQRQLCFGGNIAYRSRSLLLGLSAVHYRFRFPFTRLPYPYDKYAGTGKGFANASLSYSYTSGNAHFFGEAAVNSGFKKAFINGLLLSASSRVDIALLHRHISAAYHAPYAAAFTESAAATNENGIYLGISIRPVDSWQINAYADFFKFPWLRYRVDAPSAGIDYLLQVGYKPGKRLEISSRLQVQSKAINMNPGLLTLSPVIRQTRKSWRTQVNYRFGGALELRGRTELGWIGDKETGREAGFICFLDLLYKPVQKPYSGSIRMQYFETDSYNSRVYAYENDVLYSFSVPVFYETGHRYYINLHYNINKRLETWLRWSQTIYRGKNLIGSGLDEINGNTRSEVKLQVMYKF